MIERKVKTLEEQCNRISPGVEIEGDSKTVPNESYTIVELMSRVQSGLGINGEIRDGIWVSEMSHEDVDLSKLKHLDLAELDEFARHSAELIEKYKQAEEQARVAEEQAKPQQVPTEEPDSPQE